MKPILTIAIPTYNRNDSLYSLVSSLLGILTNEVEILVLDNASDVSAEETLEPLTKNYEGDELISIYRNPCNIGMSGNIMRCFELSKGDYVWLLGDDDTVSQDSILTIFSYLKKYEQAVFFSFDLPKRHYRLKTTVCDGSNFLDSVDRFGPTIFISSSVFQREFMLKHLKYGYIFATTLAPHFAVLLLGLKRGNLCVFSKDTIADNNKDSSNAWSYFAGAISFPLLLDSLSEIELKKKLARKMLDLLHPLNVAIGILYHSKDRGEQRAFVSYYFSYFSARLYSLCSIKVKTQWLFLSCSWIFPNLFLNIILFYKRKRYKGFSLQLTSLYERI